MEPLIFCSCVLSVLTAIITGQQVLANSETTWKDLNEAANLTCPHPCPGVITWERENHKVAESGRKEGLEFSCERFQNQGFLNVPHVNYSTRGFYYTRCDGKEICFQNLQPNCQNSSAEGSVGGSLTLDLLTLHPVELMFTRTEGGDGSTVQVCSVDGRSVQPGPGYENRLVLSENSLVLRVLRTADSGVYSVLEHYKGETWIKTVSLSVKGGPVWRAVLLVAVSMTFCIVLVVVMVRLWRENQQLKKKTGTNTDTTVQKRRDCHPPI